jgi:hypothetical protein
MKSMKVSRSNLSSSNPSSSFNTTTVAQDVVVFADKFRNAFGGLIFFLAGVLYIDRSRSALETEIRRLESESKLRESESKLRDAQLELESKLADAQLELATMKNNLLYGQSEEYRNMRRIELKEAAAKKNDATDESKQGQA